MTEWIVTRDGAQIAVLLPPDRPPHRDMVPREYHSRTLQGTGGLFDGKLDPVAVTTREEELHYG